MPKFTVSRCPCGHPACNDFHINPVAAVQGVKFTSLQAEIVAAVLNATDSTLNSTEVALAELRHMIERAK